MTEMNHFPTRHARKPKAKTAVAKMKKIDTKTPFISSELLLLTSTGLAVGQTLGIGATAYFDLAFGTPLLFALLGFFIGLAFYAMRRT